MPQFLYQMFGAYFSALSYGQLPVLVTNASDRSQAASLLAITLMVGIYVGLGFSFAVSAPLKA